jgi:hypothetical protein
MNFNKDSLAVLGTLIAVVVIFTLISGGNLKLGTSEAGPYFSTAFRGPKGPALA